jgi:hypothetical protein
MAVLPDADRARIYRGLMRFWSRIDVCEPIPSVKVVVRSAVDAADNWADANAAAYNNALPAEVKTQWSANAKAMLLAMVVLARYNPTLLAAILGEVN